MTKWLGVAVTLATSHWGLANAESTAASCESTLASAREACLAQIVQMAQAADQVVKIERGAALSASQKAHASVIELNGIVSPTGRRVDSVYRVDFSGTQSHYSVEVRLAYGNFDRCKARVMQVHPYWPDGPGGAPSGD